MIKFEIPKREKCSSEDDETNPSTSSELEPEFQQIQETLKLDPFDEESDEESLQDHLSDSGTSRSADLHQRNEFIQHNLKYATTNYSAILDYPEFNPNRSDLVATDSTTRKIPRDISDLSPHILRCFEDTNKACASSMKDNDKQVFSYYEFQASINFQRQNDDNLWLRDQLNQKVVVKYGNNGEVKEYVNRIRPVGPVYEKEFDQCYGPVNHTDKRMEKYLASYKESQKEILVKRKKKLDFLEGGHWLVILAQIFFVFCIYIPNNLQPITLAVIFFHRSGSEIWKGCGPSVPRLRVIEKNWIGEIRQFTEKLGY